MVDGYIRNAEKLLNFNKNIIPTIINPICIGYYYNPIYSVIMNIYEQSLLLQYLGELQENSYLQLIYRASETTNGFTAKEYHKQCDYRRNTIIVILTEHGNIFGGYTATRINNQLDLEGCDDKSIDGKNSSFVFLLRSSRGDKPAQYKLINKKGAIHQNPKCISVFGFLDFYTFIIRDRANEDERCESNIQRKNYDIPKDDALLGGSKKFKVLDFEVFQLKVASVYNKRF